MPVVAINQFLPASVHRLLVVTNNRTYILSDLFVDGNVTSHSTCKHEHLDLST